MAVCGVVVEVAVTGVIVEDVEVATGSRTVSSGTSGIAGVVVAVAGVESTPSLF